MTTDPPWGTPYGLRQWFGHTYSDGSPIQVTNRQAQAFERMRVLLGYTEALTVIQGCHHHGSLSGTTHDKADVADISAYDYKRKAEIGASIGLIVFYRPYNWDGHGGMEHCHTILRPNLTELHDSLAGTGHLDSIAAYQVLDWDAHTDGLYHAGGKQPYRGPWYPVDPFLWHPNYGADPTPPDPPKEPQLETYLHAYGEANRAIDAALVEGVALVKAQPNRPVLSAIVERQQAAKRVAEADWKTLKDATTA